MRGQERAGSAFHALGKSELNLNDNFKNDEDLATVSVDSKATMTFNDVFAGEEHSRDIDMRRATTLSRRIRMTFQTLGLRRSRSLKRTGAAWMLKK
jgi:hypothetical protein